MAEHQDSEQSTADNSGFVKLEIDPHELGGVFRLMTPKSFHVYKISWLDFVKFAGITVERKPEEQDFSSFFEMKRNAGLSGNSLRCCYSHLNKIFSHLYNRKLGVSTKSTTFN